MSGKENHQPGDGSITVPASNGAVLLAGIDSPTWSLTGTPASGVAGTCSSGVGSGGGALFGLRMLPAAGSDAKASTCHGSAPLQPEAPAGVGLVTPREPSLFPGFPDLGEEEAGEQVVQRQLAGSMATATSSATAGAGAPPDAPGGQGLLQDGPAWACAGNAPLPPAGLPAAGAAAATSPVLPVNCPTPAMVALTPSEAATPPGTGSSSGSSDTPWRAAEGGAAGGPAAPQPPFDIQAGALAAAAAQGAAAADDPLAVFQGATDLMGQMDAGRPGLLSLFDLDAFDDDGDEIGMRLPPIAAAVLQAPAPAAVAAAAAVQAPAWRGAIPRGPLPLQLQNVGSSATRPFLQPLAAASPGGSGSSPDVSATRDTTPAPNTVTPAASKAKAEPPGGGPLPPGGDVPTLSPDSSANHETPSWSQGSSAGSSASSGVAGTGAGMAGAAVWPQLLPPVAGAAADAPAEVLQHEALRIAESLLLSESHGDTSSSGNGGVSRLLMSPPPAPGFGQRTLTLTPSPGPFGPQGEPPLLQQHQEPGRDFAAAAAAATASLAAIKLGVRRLVTARLGGAGGGQAELQAAMSELHARACDLAAMPLSPAAYAATDACKALHFQGAATPAPPGRGGVPSVLPCSGAAAGGGGAQQQLLQPEALRQAYEAATVAVHVLGRCVYGPGGKAASSFCHSPLIRHALPA